MEREGKVKIEIHRAPADLMPYLMEPEKLSQWLPSVREVKLVKGTNREIGQQIEIKGAFLGNKIDFTAEAVKLEWGKNLVFKTVKAPFPVEYGYTLEPIPQGTRLTLHMKTDPGTFFKLAEPVLESITRRTWETAIVTLKDLAEAKQPVGV